MTDWDESEHPRDRRGRFTRSGGWAAQAISNMGLADPEFQAARDRHGEWLSDVYDTVQGVFQHRDDPYWMEHHKATVRQYLEHLPPEFERDPRTLEARKIALSAAPRGIVMGTFKGEQQYERELRLPWRVGHAMAMIDDYEDAFPFWRAEIERLLRRQGYDLEKVEEFLGQTAYEARSTHAHYAGGPSLAATRSVEPSDIVAEIVSNLHQLSRGQPGLAAHVTKNNTGFGADQSHLRTADADFDNRIEGDHGGKQLKARQLDDHPDFATSGEFEIWLDGGWHLLEEVYHDDPDEEEIEVIAGDQHLMIDTSDDIELRRIPIEQRPRRRWWE